MNGSKSCSTFTQWNTTQQKKRRNCYLLWQMDGTGEHYAKWNKPGVEGQIPYDLTFNWNIINRRKKQTKYNQRHWNKEQSDSNQRGGGRGIIWDHGGGHQGTCMKGTRIKPKGVGLRVGSGHGWSWGALWGENGDNLTWITIKNHLNK